MNFGFPSRLTSVIWLLPLVMHSSLNASILENPDPMTYGEFAYSVGVSGAMVIAGAPRENIGPGEAYLYDTTGGSVSGPIAPRVSLTPTASASNDLFGTSASLLGTTGLLGAPGTSSSQGAAYLYRHLATTTGTPDLPILPNSPTRG